MTRRERIEVIEALVWIQGWSREAYEKMTDEELEKKYAQEMNRRSLG